MQEAASRQIRLFSIGTRDLCQLSFEFLSLFFIIWLHEYNLSLCNFILEDTVHHEEPWWCQSIEVHVVCWCVCRQIFCDFGDNFTVIDANGEAPLQYLVDNITQASLILSASGVLTCKISYLHHCAVCFTLYVSMITAYFYRHNAIYQCPSACHVKSLTSCDKTVTPTDMISSC